MKILYGKELVNELRRICDKVTNRLWICVPYLGNPVSVRRILGKQWYDNPSVSVRVITDTSEKRNYNAETLRHFHDRGEVKTILGLHAKIYLIDDACLVTSANLTNTAFSKRHEIGVFFTGKAINPFLEVFGIWWNVSKNIKPDAFQKTNVKDKNSTEENEGISLPTLWGLPEDPGGLVKNLAKRFLNYDRLLAEYNDFAHKYSSIQRIWPDKPLNFEIDGLFNYLYHEAPKQPSKEYAKKKPRLLSEEQQIREITKWANSYRKWNQEVRLKERGVGDIHWRLSNSRKLKRMLKASKITSLSKSELNQVFSSLNSLNAYPINRTKILSNNSLKDIREALYQLIYGKGQLAARMDFCNRIKNLGSSSMNEIIGFTSPNKYPLINKNSNCGLRFFGYQIKAY